MQTAQTRTVLSLRILVAIVLGAALIVALGSLAMSDAAAVAVGEKDGNLGVAADDPPAASGESLIKYGHRYHLYLADGGTMGASPARYQGVSNVPSDHSNHRYFADETMIQGDESYPENHRISQLAD